MGEPDLENSQVFRAVSEQGGHGDGLMGLLRGLYSKGLDSGLHGDDFEKLPFQSLPVPRP